jgi:hypothetical protein
MRYLYISKYFPKEYWPFHYFPIGLYEIYDCLEFILCVNREAPIDFLMQDLLAIDISVMRLFEKDLAIAINSQIDVGVVRMANMEVDL